MKFLDTTLRRSVAALVLAAAAAPTSYAVEVPAQLKKLLKKTPEPSALDEFIQLAHRRASMLGLESPGSLYTPSGLLSDIAMDLKARNIDDVVTIVVNEQASAVSTGATKTSRASSASGSITSLAGTLATSGRLSNLANMTGTSTLDGQGTTSRTTTLTTTITARVSDVLPNGYLVIEGHRSVKVNSENQDVTLRGVIRPADLTNANTVLSSSVAQMELKIDGKGVVNDAVRRPNFLYRLLLGILPF